METAFSIHKLVNLIFYFYYLLIIIRIFLTWIPNIDWYSQPYKFISSITDPFLNIFRKYIPPVGGVLDISPVMALVLLEFVRGQLVNFLFTIGL